jgi:hypothetical protein
MIDYLIAIVGGIVIGWFLREWYAMRKIEKLIDSIGDNMVDEFKKKVIDITVEKNQLTVEGNAPKGAEEVKYLHKGIGNRNFRRSFTLAEHVEVANATLDYGMLNIHLVRNIPEELQPKRIMITAPNEIEG